MRYLFVLLTVFCLQAKSQITSDEVIQDLGIDQSRNYFQMMSIKPSDPKVVGDRMLFGEWTKCDITLKNGKTLKNVSANYDILMDILYAQVSTGIASLDPDIVLELKETNGLFEYVRPKLSTDGFSRIVCKNGPFEILEFVEIIEKKPDYNVALDVGSRDYKLIKKFSICLRAEGEMVEVTKNKSRKKFFGKKYKELNKLVKSDGLTWNDTSDLCAIIKIAEKYQ